MTRLAAAARLHMGQTRRCLPAQLDRPLSVLLLLLLLLLPLPLPVAALRCFLLSLLLPALRRLGLRPRQRCLQACSMQRSRPLSARRWPQPHVWPPNVIVPSPCHR